MEDPAKLKILMDEMIQDAIQKFEKATGLTVVSIGTDKRFNKSNPVKVYSNVELRFD